MNLQPCPQVLLSSTSPALLCCSPALLYSALVLCSAAVLLCCSAALLLCACSTLQHHPARATARSPEPRSSVLRRAVPTWRSSLLLVRLEPRPLADLVVRVLVHAFRVLPRLLLFGRHVDVTAALPAGPRQRVPHLLQRCALRGAQARRRGAPGRKQSVSQRPRRRVRAAARARTVTYSLVMRGPCQFHQHFRIG